MSSYQDLLEPIARDVIAPASIETDRAGAFPRQAITALGKAGLLGLISA